MIVNQYLAVEIYTLFALYTHEDLLPAKKKEYRIAEAILKYYVEPEEEEAPENPERLRSREPQLQGDPRNLEGGVCPDEEVPTQQERITSSERSGGAPQDTYSPGGSGAELPSHRQQPQGHPK